MAHRWNVNNVVLPYKLLFLNETVSQFVSEQNRERKNEWGSSSQLNKEKWETLEEENWNYRLRLAHSGGGGQIWGEVTLTGRDPLVHNIRNKEDERDTGERLSSLWLSHNLEVFLGHKQRLCAHNSVWFRAAIECSGIISSIICRKLWPDWIRGILVFAARLLLSSFSFSIQSQSVLLHSAPSNSFNFLMNIQH